MHRESGEEQLVLERDKVMWHEGENKKYSAERAKLTSPLPEWNKALLEVFHRPESGALKSRQMETQTAMHSVWA